MKALKDNLTQKIEKFMDKVYGSPLSEKEVLLLEKKIKVKFPQSFRLFLLEFGISQDLIQNNYFETIGQFISEKEYIDRTVPEGAKDYFAFGNNGYGDLFLMRDAVFEDEYIYKLSHDSGSIKKTKETFSQYVNSAIEKVIKEYKKRKHNNEKKWVFQLSFETNNEKELFDQLKNFGIIPTTNKWILGEKFPSGVSEYHIVFSSNAESLMMKKMEYKDWQTPAYTIEFSILLSNKKEKKQIHEIDLAFRNLPELGYKLISFGIQ